MSRFRLPALCDCGRLIESCPDHAPAWAWVEGALSDPYTAQTWADGTPLPPEPPDDFDPWERP